MLPDVLAKIHKHIRPTSLHKKMKVSIKDFFSKCDQIRSLSWFLTRSDFVAPYDSSLHKWQSQDIIVTLYKKTFLFIKLKAFDASTSRTASQVWSFVYHAHYMYDGLTTSFLSSANLKWSYWRNYVCSYVCYNCFTSYVTQHLDYTYSSKSRIFVEWN